jgi:hypothetical protein
MTLSALHSIQFFFGDEHQNDRAELLRFEEAISGKIKL